MCVGTRVAGFMVESGKERLVGKEGEGRLEGSDSDGDETLNPDKRKRAARR